MSAIDRPSSLPPATARFVVVEASAGTGKTFFLEHRVVDLILGAGAELGQILLVTFTDKAVAELRLRIRDLLDRAARADESNGWIIDDAARTRLRAAVTAFDHAPIFTIHGFCHRVLIEDAFAARRLFQQTQVADEVAFDAAFGALLRERFANVSPDIDMLSAYLQWEGTVDTLRDLLLKCARADARPPRRFEGLRAIAAFEALKAAFTPTKCEALLLDVNWKGKHGYAAGWLATVSRAIAQVGAHPSSILGACDYIRKEGGATLLKYLGPKQANAAAALADAIKLMPLDEAIASELLPHVLDRIRFDKAEHGMFDYDDMLELVRDALHGERGPELAARLRERMPWVMIDEFQDTDPVQWDIFRTVWMHDEAKGLTIVGDPKQAIYGFRGADVATYVAARDELMRNGATEVTLDVNRRSTKPLVDVVNALLIGQQFAPLLDKTITYDHPVTASGDVTSFTQRPPLTAFVMREGRKDDNRTALAREIGAEIEKLRANPPQWTSRGNTPPFSLGHVMVLTRSNKESVTIAEALRARGLACALVESDKLFETREAAELAAVLDSIAAPRDRSARMRALRTRFFDVPWVDLMRVVDAPDHHPLIARLFDWAALAVKREYEPLFRRVVEDSRFAERALVLGGGERALVNTWHLIELLLEEVSRSRCDLHELVTRLRRWINEHEELADDRDIQRAETDADAIRILTIHKAKGLEAPYVFLYGCASKGPRSKVDVVRDGAGRVLHVSAHDERVRKQIEDEADAENQRLAYVALTRAQIRLYLPHYAEKVVDDRSTYHPIQRCLTPLLTHKHALVEQVEVDVDAEDEPAAPVDALANLDVPTIPTVAELAALEPARAGLAMLSYTRLAKSLDAAALEPGELPLAIDPAEFDVDNAHGADQPVLAPTDLPPGADSGLLLHDILENADLALVRDAASAEEWTADPDVASMIADCARGRGIADLYLPHAAQLAYATLTKPLALVEAGSKARGTRSTTSPPVNAATAGTVGAASATLPPMIAATALAREVEFTYPIPGAHSPRGPRGLVKGYIDALIAYDDDLWVLDYKSDLLAGTTPDELAAAARERAKDSYEIQARLYAIAADRLRGSRRFAGLLFAFIRYGIVVPVRMDAGALASHTNWLANLRTEVSR